MEEAWKLIREGAAVWYAEGVKEVLSSSERLLDLSSEHPVDIRFRVEIFEARGEEPIVIVYPIESVFVWIGGASRVSRIYEHLKVKLLKGREMTLIACQTESMGRDALYAYFLIETKPEGKQAIYSWRKIS